jgi:hypothetical protein
MEYKIELDLKDGYVHYFFDNEYLGMLVFEKGELSDFRAVIRINRLKINKNNLYDNLRVSLFELLNQYLKDKKFIDVSILQKVKTKIVKESEGELKRIERKVEL